jgi:hypothetical protein
MAFREKIEEKKNYSRVLAIRGSRTTSKGHGGCSATPNGQKEKKKRKKKL